MCHLLPAGHRALSRGYGLRLNLPTRVRLPEPQGGCSLLKSTIHAPCLPRTGPSVHACSLGVTWLVGVLLLPEPLRSCIGADDAFRRQFIRHLPALPPARHLLLKAPVLQHEQEGLLDPGVVKTCAARRGTCSSVPLSSPKREAGTLPTWQKRVTLRSFGQCSLRWVTRVMSERDTWQTFSPCRTMSTSDIELACLHAAH